MAAGTPAYVLRFVFAAVFGKRGPLLQSFSRWIHDIAGPVAGLELDRCVFSLGFIGTSHSTAQLDCSFDSWGGASEFLCKLSERDLDPWTSTPEREWVVGGSRRWEVLRCVGGDAASGDIGIVVQWSMTSSPGRLFELVAHVGPAIGDVLRQIGLGHTQRRVLVGVLGQSEDAVTVEMDLADMGQLNALLAHMESGAAASFIGAIAQEGFVVAGSQNWTVLRKLPI